MSPVKSYRHAKIRQLIVDPARPGSVGLALASSGISVKLSAEDP